MIGITIRRILGLPISIVTTVKDFFEVMWFIWKSMKFVLHFGDLTKVISRGVSPENIHAIDAEALKNWTNEGQHLLPHRYRHILDRLLNEQALSDEQYQGYMHRAAVTLLHPNLGKAIGVEKIREIAENMPAKFPWVDDPLILQQTSDSLRSKINAFDKRYKIYVSYVEVAAFNQIIDPSG